jgi:hypothetical protein
MAGGQIDVWFVRGVTPDVVTHRCIHVLARGIQIFLVAFDFVNERGFGNCDRDVVLLTTRLSRRRRRISCQRAHMTDGLLPQLAMRGAGPYSQFCELFVGDIDARMHAFQFGEQLRVTSPHQFEQRMLAFQFVT